ncbi:uncharacterized protein [Phyllobates terribilis]|uniref:uncharacterized protein n=1 Tax=Phyllobates terribilis TaxID=111132 RepID=UPI003CCB5E7F
MASSKSLDPKSGYCSSTRIYHSLRPSVPLPPESAPVSISDAVISFLHSSTGTTSLDSVPAFINSGTGESISYSLFLQQIRSLSSALRRGIPGSPPIRKGDIALILSPSSLRVPVLYFSLLSIGAVVSPASPLLSDSELAHIVSLVKPTVAFAVSSFSPSRLAAVPTVFIDSPEFESLLNGNESDLVDSVVISQSDRAAILFSSGTTGKMKGVEMTHRNLIALISGLYYSPRERKADGPSVPLFTLPLFHVFGMFMMLRAVAMAETSVLLAKFTLEGMLSTVEKYKVTYMPVSPPVVVLLVKSELTEQYDLRSLESIGSGGAALSESVARRFKAKFPWIDCIQGYGLTETCGVAARPFSPEEGERYGSVGHLAEQMQAKIVDPSTNEPLPPGERGELWLKGPTIMKGYIGDEESTKATFSDGWLKTGDICYFDAEGFLYIVDRLKELIKYKGYQVPPVELENVLLSHPQVADAAVVPYPDEVAGQIPMAFIVRQPGSSVTSIEIMDFVAKEVSPYKKIRRVVFIKAIPRSPAGKILRRELVSQAVSASSRL